MDQVAQRCSRGPIPGDTQGQASYASDQSKLVQGVPDHCSGLDKMIVEGPFQPNTFCGSVISRSGDYIELFLSGFGLGFLEGIFCFE